MQDFNPERRKMQKMKLKRSVFFLVNFTLTFLMIQILHSLIKANFYRMQFSNIATLFFMEQYLSVRPILEFCVQAWRPWMDKDISVGGYSEKSNKNDVWSKRGLI